jgi:hypothetical protein
MPWLKAQGSSLLDTINRYPVDWWLVYSDMDDQTHFMGRLFKRGFQHVLALRRDGRVWVAIHPHFSFVDVQVIREDLTPWAMYPEATIQHIIAMRENAYSLSEFHVGPLTCVELIKSLLGIRAWYVRSPWQLYRYCRRVYG